MGTGLLALTLEQRVEQIETLLGPPPWAPLHSFVIETVRETWITSATLSLKAGTAISVDGTTISHRTGNFGDLHTNYAEPANTEIITALWTFNAGLNIPHGQTLQFGADVTLTRGAADQLVLGSGDDFRSGDYASGVSGWMVNESGTAEFQDVWLRGALHGTVFVKDMIEARAGTILVGKSAGVMTRDSTITVAPPNYVYIKEPPGGGYLFEATDVIYLKSACASGVKATWLQVVSRADMGSGEQQYTCTYQSGSSAVTYPKGSPVVDYGQSGDGLLLMTAELVYSPYYDVITHAGAPWTTTTLKVRVGNLAGVTDPDLSPSGYGLFATNVFLKGDLVAGAGNVILDSVGLTMIAGQSATNIIKWKEGTHTIWKMAAWETPAVAIEVLMQNESLPATTEHAQVRIGVEDWSTSFTYMAINSGTSTLPAGITFFLRELLKLGIYSNAGVIVFDDFTIQDGPYVRFEITKAAGDVHIYGTATFESDALAQSGKYFLDDSETDPRAGLWNRMINPGSAAIDSHAREGSGVPTGLTWYTTPSEAYNAHNATYSVYVYGTYFTMYPGHATKLSYLAIAADPLGDSKHFWGRMGVTGGCEMGIRADNFDSDRSYALNERFYYFDVYLYGDGPQTRIRTRSGYWVSNGAGAWTGPNNTAGIDDLIGPIGEYHVLDLMVNSGGTSRCYAYLKGREALGTAGVANVFLYDDAGASNQYKARRVGFFVASFGFAYSGFDWYSWTG